MSQPRAARKGGKVSAAPTPASTGAASSFPSSASTTEGKPPTASTASNEPTPGSTPQPLSLGSVGTPGSLSSFLETIDASSSPAMSGPNVGVVRGRGQTTPLKESKSSFERDEVTSRVRELLEGLPSATAPASPTTATGSLASAPVSLVGKSDVCLLSDVERLTTPCRLVKDKAENHVLIVVPHLDDADLTQAGSLLGNANLVGSFQGCTRKGSESARLWMTTYQSFFSFTSPAVVQGTADPLAKFTHLCVWNNGQASRASTDALVAWIRHFYPRNTPTPKSQQSGKSKAKILLVGFEGQFDALSKFFAPLKVLQVEASTRSHSIAEFTNEEVAALVDMPLKEAGPSLANQRFGTTESLHPRVAEHANEVTAALLAHVVETSKAPQSIVIFAAEPAETCFTIKKKLSKELLAKVMLLTSLKAKTIEESNASSKHRVYLLNGTISDLEAQCIGASIVIDLSTEKRTLVPPKPEAFFPIRQVSLVTKSYTAQRHRALGWKSDGIYFAVLKPLNDPPKSLNAPPTPGGRSVTDDEELVPPLVETILELTRCQIPVTGALFDCAVPRSDRERQMESAMHLLSEMALIASPSEPFITFIGDLVGRLPVNVDQAMCVVHGLALGIPELTTLCAAVATSPVFGSATPSSTGDLSNEEWIAKTSAFKAELDPTGACSDVLADAGLCLRYLAAAADSQVAAEALCTKYCVQSKNVETALNYFKACLTHLEDYAFFDSKTILTTAEGANALLTEFNNNGALLTYIVAVSLSRRAVIVRAEEDPVKRTKPKGSSVFTRTQKEVQPGSFTPSAVRWSNGTILVATSLTNTPHKLFANGVTAISHKYFHALLLLLHPSISYDQSSQDVATFQIAFNHQSKRLTCDLASTARVLEFREKWNKSMGCVQLKRSLPTATAAQFTTFLSQADRKLNLTKLRQEMCTELLELVQEIETKESQAAPVLGRVQTFAPAPPHQLDASEIGEGSDTVLARQVRALNFASRNPMAVPTVVNKNATTDAPTAEATVAESSKKNDKKRGGKGKESAAAKRRAAAAADDDEVVEVQQSRSELLVAAIVDDDDMIEDANAQRSQHQVVIEDDD